MYGLKTFHSKLVIPEQAVFRQLQAVFFSPVKDNSDIGNKTSQSLVINIA